ncbi:MAG: glycosyltransferase [Pseudomonadota bacterium]
MGTPGHVAICMATRNGAAYLPAQLDSLRAQTHKDWSLIASDDGSTDATWDILGHAFQTITGHRRKGPQQGFAANFLSMLSELPADTDYVAFCDQDDVWAREKLERAIRHLPAPDRLGFYAACARPCDATLVPLDRGFRCKAKRLSLDRAFWVSDTLGNTVVMTRALSDLVARTAAHAAPLRTHDWLAYLCAAACGADMVHDPWAAVAYRQHGANTIGAARGLTGLITKGGHLASGRYAAWVNANAAALAALGAAIIPDARDEIARLESLRAPGREADLTRHLRKTTARARVEMGERAPFLVAARMGLLSRQPPRYAWFEYLANSARAT